MLLKQEALLDAGALFSRVVLEVSYLQACLSSEMLLILRNQAFHFFFGSVAADFQLQALERRAGKACPFQL